MATARIAVLPAAAQRSFPLAPVLRARESTSASQWPRDQSAPLRLRGTSPSGCARSREFPVAALRVCARRPSTTIAVGALGFEPAIRRHTRNPWISRLRPTVCRRGARPLPGPPAVPRAAGRDVHVPRDGAALPSRQMVLRLAGGASVGPAWPSDGELALSAAACESRSRYDLDPLRRPHLAYALTTALCTTHSNSSGRAAQTSSMARRASYSTKHSALGAPPRWVTVPMRSSSAPSLATCALSPPGSGLSRQCPSRSFAPRLARAGTPSPSSDRPLSILTPSTASKSSPCP